MEKAGATRYMTVTPPRYSIVVPIYNEEHNIIPLFNEIKVAMTAMKASWEVLFINDGSKDSSGKVLDDLSIMHPTLRHIRLKNNAGQTAAFDAGFKQARGDFIITLDGDGQNAPGDIPKLAAFIEQGFDLIAGRREKRNDSLTKRLISKTANAVRQRILQDGVQDTGCSLKLFRREILQKFCLYKGMHRFFPALVLIHGGTVKEVEVSHRPRTSGSSKYSLFNRGPSLIMDMLAVAWMKKRRLEYEVEIG